MSHLRQCLHRLHCRIVGHDWEHVVMNQWGFEFEHCLRCGATQEVLPTHPNCRCVMLDVDEEEK